MVTAKSSVASSPTKGGDESSLDALQSAMELEHVQREGTQPTEAPCEDDEWEPPMHDQDRRFDGYLEPGQGLIVTSKLMSLTLLGGLRYRALIKFGFADRSELFVSAILDPEASSYQPEGDLNCWFEEYYTAVDDPMDLRGEARQAWFVCYLAEVWLDRFITNNVLGETAVWGQ